MEQECKKHGLVRHVKETDRWRCFKCRSEAVTKRRRKLKKDLVEAFGGKCMRCGYSKSIRALSFHHKDPSLKQFGIAERGLTRSLEKLCEEAAKCILLCMNCHAELHEEECIAE